MLTYPGARRALIRQGDPVGERSQAARRPEEGGTGQSFEQGRVGLLDPSGHHLQRVERCPRAAVHLHRADWRVAVGAPATVVEHLRYAEVEFSTRSPCGKSEQEEPSRLFVEARAERQPA